MNDIRTKELFTSSNGDRWHLCKEASGRLFVAHQANLPSGGHISRIELADFLARGYGPEQQSLLRLIGTLLDPAPAELLGGEGDPGLSVSGLGIQASPILALSLPPSDKRSAALEPRLELFQ